MSVDQQQGRNSPGSAVALDAELSALHAQVTERAENARLLRLLELAPQQARPNILTGSGPLPRIAADAQGYAEQASMGSGSSGLSVAPGRLAAVTAGALDGSAAAKITVPDNLQDQKDQAFWRSRLLRGSTDTDAHRQASSAVYGLRTADGGALLTGSCWMPPCTASVLKRIPFKSRPIVCSSLTSAR